MARSKVFDSFAAAVADIADGATIGIGGFAGPGTPYNLLQALRDQGAQRLTVVANTTGGAHQPRLPDAAMLAESGQMVRFIGSFTAANRPTDVIPFTQYYQSGACEAEVVPQGTLAERLRAAGCGIPAFYTPTAVGTKLAEGRETRIINGREYLLEYAQPLDVALIRAWKADEAGNLVFRLAQRNFCPLMAMAARLTLVEVEEPILPLGALEPDHIHTPGIFVQRMVVVPPAPDGIWTVRRVERAR